MSLTTTTGGMGLVPQSMDQAVRLAEMMAKGKLVPAHLQNSPGDCLMVIEQAMRWRMSPFAVAQATSIVKGKLNYEGKLVAAALHTSGALTSRLSYDYSGAGASREVRVSAVLAGEMEPRSIDVKLADAKTTNEYWTKQPDQQLAYHAARVWARRYAPEVMLGVYAPEEMETAPQPAHNGPTIDVRAEVMPEPEPAPIDKVRQGADALVARFAAVTNAQEYYELIDSDGHRIAWLKDKRPELFTVVDTARQAAADRMEETPVDEAPAAVEPEEVV